VAAGADHAARLSECLAAWDGSGQTPHDLFGQVDDAFWFWLNTQGYREHAALREILPGMPDETTQANFTGRSGDATLADGFQTYRLIKHGVDAHGGGLAQCQRILDFGCGWGRITRFFLRDLAPSRILGIDCMPEAVELCVATNRWCPFQLVATMPPTGLEAGQFDVVYAYSVFSHLSEAAHQQWLGEFQRLLKPGGLAILTTRDREFINYCQTVRQQSDRPGFAAGTASAFPDTRRWLAAYDRGEFCHTPAGGGSTLSDSFYGETCIPKRYAETHWTKAFSIVDFIADRARCEQNVVIARKKPL
jgi:SAM-dependent methyltransferase